MLLTKDDFRSFAEAHRRGMEKLVKKPDYYGVSMHKTNRRHFGVTFRRLIMSDSCKEQRGWGKVINLIGSLIFLLNLGNENTTLKSNNVIILEHFR